MGASNTYLYMALLTCGILASGLSDPILYPISIELQLLQGADPRPTVCFAKPAAQRRPRNPTGRQAFLANM